MSPRPAFHRRSIKKCNNYWKNTYLLTFRSYIFYEKDDVRVYLINQVIKIHENDWRFNFVLDRLYTTLERIYECMEEKKGAYVHHKI